jgi:hypothetical protein
MCSKERNKRSQAYVTLWQHPADEEDPHEAIPDTFYSLTSFPSLEEDSMHAFALVCVCMSILKSLRLTRLQHICNATQLCQFIDLWLLLRNIQLSDVADKISWKWTPDLKYSASSAYLQQFTGSFAATNV